MNDELITAAIYKNMNMDLIYCITSNRYPFIGYLNFLKSFNINKEMEKELLSKNLIKEGQEISCYDLLILAGYYAKLNINLAIYFETRAHYVSKEIPIKLRAKFKIMNDIIFGYMRAVINEENSEKYLYPIIANNINSLIKNCNIVKKKPNPKFIPDFFVEVNGELSIIEVKKDIINNMALKQIQNYLKFYKIQKGYLMAPQISDNVKLPNNIKYINIDKNFTKINCAMKWTEN